MDLNQFDNFLLVPARENSAETTVYELGNKSAYAENSFVLLPYQNPQVKNMVPQFYPVKRRLSIEALPFKEEHLSENTIRLQSVTSKENYLDKIKQLQQHIQQGNIYEINFCVRFYAEGTTIDPLKVFYALNTLAKAPYASLLKLGDDFIICASPELFLKKEGGTIYTKPIKGTIKRGKNKEEDEALKQSLQTSIKERTENVMAVDVARNDLSQFAKKGSVHVNRLYNIETFETVHQMVSTVSCDIKENTSFEKIIDATFPMASMTGAPKLRAMQLIDEFEDFERGPYSGSMGMIDENGDFTLPVIIRSIFYNQSTKRLSIAAGGAITYLSEPEKEYEECLLKANALLKALNAEIL